MLRLRIRPRHDIVRTAITLLTALHKGSHLSLTALLLRLAGCPVLRGSRITIAAWVTLGALITARLRALITARRRCITLAVAVARVTRSVRRIALRLLITLTRRIGLRLRTVLPLLPVFATGLPAIVCICALRLGGFSLRAFLRLTGFAVTVAIAATASAAATAAAFAILPAITGGGVTGIAAGTSITIAGGIIAVICGNTTINGSIGNSGMGTGGCGGTCIAGAASNGIRTARTGLSRLTVAARLTCRTCGIRRRRTASGVGDGFRSICRMLCG